MTNDKRYLELLRLYCAFGTLFKSLIDSCMIRTLDMDSGVLICANAYIIGNVVAILQSSSTLLFIEIPLSFVIQIKCVLNFSEVWLRVIQQSKKAGYEFRDIASRDLVAV